jgi:ubiquitin C-terminal hydrolase
MKLYSFYNLGNTCYLNTVLQCFINDLYFKNNVNIPLLESIQNDLTDNDENINHKHSILNIVNYFDKNFKRFDQHDAHEFLLHFINEFKLNYCYGKMKTNVTCSICKNVSSTFEDFSTINLDLNGSNLINTFMDYLKKENIHEYQCDNCKNKVEASKKSFLYTLPSHLIVVLKTYINKNETQFENCDLKIRETKSGNILNYTLYAIIYHYGNIDNGHYNCTVKINNKWYFIDDEHIVQLKEYENICNKNSYILFYKQF